MKANVANVALVVQVAIANIVANQATFVVKLIVISWITFVVEMTVVNQAKFVLKLV